MMGRFDSGACCDNITIIMSSSRDFFEIAGIFFVSLILFTWGVSSQEVIGFESRFYLFALEMWRNGAHWFPTTYHKLYPDYPATSTFLIYLTANFLGQMNKLAAVIPTAIAASITMVMTYLIGALNNKRWGLYAVFFLFLTVVFLKSARSITLDMYTAMITTCCFYIVYSADVKHLLDRPWFIYPLLLLGFAFRGPIGLVIPAGVVCIYYLQDRNFKNLFFSGVFALLLLMLCMVILLAIANQVGGDEFVRDVLRMEIVGRLDQSNLPPYFYLTAGLKDYALSFPLALVSALGVIYYEQRLHHHSAELKLMLKLIGWIAVIFIGMSIPGDKKIRYVLGAAPAMALMASFPFVAPKTEKFFTLLSWLLVRFFLIFPALLFIALRFVMTYANKHAINFNIDYLLATQMMFGSLALEFLVFICLIKKPRWRVTGVLLIATLCFVVSYIMVVEPIEQYADRTKEFVKEVENARRHSHANLVFYKETPDSLPIKYLINMPYEEMPSFIDNENHLMMFAGPAFFVTSESYYKDLSAETVEQLRVIARDKIGHVPVVVFTNR